ncbi:AI-2E family transporter [Klenkia terrae]|jgi:predicted PurR-regulated permease PerM|uniref:AI-2E family transporter n=1 Tax=Klenkia terrae TaxID=1052259 RepID=A0ABU8EC86_9ACTN|nr:AI-2E family transporter [Klenkia terrae]SSC25521.1 Transmembrane protein TqsA-like [Klenkia terrae]
MADDPQDTDGPPTGGSTAASALPPADFHDDSGEPPSETSAPVPGPERAARLSAATQVLATFSWRLLLVTGAVVVIGYVLGVLWAPVLLPVVLGLLFSTVMWPLTKLLRRGKFPPALAALTTVVLFLAAFVGIIAAIAPPVVSQVNDLATGVSSGLQSVQDWLSGPPFNLGQEQIGEYVDDAINRLQSSAGDIANFALTGASAVGTGLVNLVLALVLAFFFLKDGPRFLPWLAAQTGPRAAPHVAELSHQSWRTLSEFIRQQALVGFIDALGIGIGLLVLGVPLVLPLAVITFFAAFIPIIGAFVAGGFAVLIALVSNGFSTAVWVLLIVVVVQQVEGNVLQPILQGRGLKLHAGVVILAVTAGSSLAGIIGAFLAVPVAALLAVGYRYARDQLDGRHPERDDDGRVPELVGDAEGARLTRSAEPVRD